MNTAKDDADAAAASGRSRNRESLGVTLRRVILPGLAINAAVLWLLRDHLAGLAGARLRAPDWELLAQETFAVQLHLFAALAALLVAILMLAGPKGTRAHRIVGWSWALLMMTTALSSFFIQSWGSLSPIHILAGWTAFATPLGVWAARTHRVRLHQRMMTGLVVGGLAIAGVLTFIPGRLMWAIFFG
jgi:uncharacterized membrane protein